MKQILIFLLVVLHGLQAACQVSGVKFEMLEFSEALKKAREENKNVFLDAYTEWCVPCKRMDKEVFTSDKVAEYLNPRFVNVKFDMEKGEGIQLKEHYGVSAFPTYMVINPDGELLHKMVGYMEVDNLLAKIKKGMNREFSSGLMRKKFLAGERSPAFIQQYKKVLRETYDMAGLLWLYRELFPGQSDHERFDSSSWAVYKSTIRSPRDTVFRYMLYHQDLVSRYVPKDELVNKLKVVSFVTLFDHYTNKKRLTEPELVQLMNDIRFIPVDFADDVNVLARAILLEEAGEFDQLLSLYEQYVSGLTINKTFWDRHLAGMSFETDAQNQRVKAYLMKAKLNCHPNAEKFYRELLENYLSGNSKTGK